MYIHPHITFINNAWQIIWHILLLRQHHHLEVQRKMSRPLAVLYWESSHKI